MPIQFFISLIITVVLPIAWVVADFKSRPTIRRILGVLAILWSCGVAAMLGSLVTLNANSYFSSASKELLEVSVENLSAGKTNAVLQAWSQANKDFSPTYENRAHYKEVVDKAIAQMKKP